MPLPSRADAAVLRVHSLALKKNDTVMLRPPSSDLPPFIGRVERVDPDGKAAPGELRGQPSLYLAWFYRPEEVNGGRREFHGAREVFLSDHRDWCHANSVEALCRVMSLQAYQESNVIQPNDFFCRFFYSASTATFRPDEVPVYCICDKPYNPDVFMVEVCGSSCAPNAGPALLFRSPPATRAAHNDSAERASTGSTRGACSCRRRKSSE